MNRRVVISSCLLLVMLFGIICSTSFLHSHIYKGHEIVHSHPTTNDDSQHSHSDSSFDTISRMCAPDTISADVVTAVEYTPIYAELSIEEIAFAEADTITSLPLLRAPPTLA